jgi:endonuclease/exonuclease/phosphatase family metal-dependent hydrolase
MKQPKNHPNPTRTFRAATYNVKFGKQPALLAKAILANPRLRSADAILLQEIEHHTREGLARAERMATELGYYWVYVPARIMRNSNTHGLAVLSRYPLSDLKIIPLQFYRLFLRSRHRVAMAVTVNWKGKPVRLYNVHLDTRLNTDDRIRQIDAVLREAEDDRCQRVIIAGDFNFMPFRWARGGMPIPVAITNQRRRLSSHFADKGYAGLPKKIGYTLKSGPLRFSIDSFFIRGGSILEAKVERTILLSDHKPLWVDCEFTN